MITRYEKFRMEDLNKERDFFVEVNWNPADHNSNACKVLKVTFPNGEHCFVRREFLHTMLFAISEPEEQRKLIPRKLITVRRYETVLSVKATKDIRKGEMITFPVSLTLPSEEEQILGDIRHKIGKIAKPPLILPPKQGSGDK